jgi:Carboxypeptidase regulatory-like domain
MSYLGPLAKPRNCICFVFLTLALYASAQVQNGEITGTVADPSGAVVPGAKIVLQNLGTRYEIQAGTNAEGIYAAKELNVGTYMVRAEAHGFVIPQPRRPAPEQYRP